jgi:GNAT superfamily N-acetyltransferase
LYTGFTRIWQQYNRKFTERLLKLIIADGRLLDTILDHTFPIWHEGLSRPSYARWNAAQLKTPWGSAHLQRFALLDNDGSLLATAKRYRHDIRLDGRDAWMSGIGAVFTPPDRRRKGYAAELIERLLEADRHEGAIVAGLFSEIGAEFYRRHGFAPLPLQEVTVSVKRKDGAPAMLVRAGDERDLPALASMHDARSSAVRFSLRRDPSMLHYALSKKRMFAGLSPTGLRQFEFFVAEEGVSAVAYVVLSVSAHGWTLEEAGDRDPAGARLGAMLQVLVAREPSHRVPLIRAWWPPAFPVPPQLELTDRSEPRDLFMMRPLGNAEVPTRAEDVFYWRSDVF